MSITLLKVIDNKYNLWLAFQWFDNWNDATRLKFQMLMLIKTYEKKEIS